MSDGTSASRRQKRMGPAPFASFEDLSDELESPDDKSTVVVRLPGIREDVTPTNTPLPMDLKEYGGISLVGAVASPASKLQAPGGTPRIDISRASSSSHHDSKDSSPDRELFEAHDPTSAKLGLGFREEGALDLRSSTEELDFQDPLDANSKKKGKQRAQSPSELHQHQRKDSSTSEIGLLSISGRTSRLSSIGSQGSAQSRLSNASHLSVLSGQSGLSRSPSPHKMLLETSFCGTKHPAKQGAVPVQGTKVESETLEKVLLSRKHDPTEAVLAEGIQAAPSAQAPPVKPSRRVNNSDITIKVDEPAPASGVSSNKIPKKIISKSGVEYIYIPLKGPLPVDDENHPREVRSASHAVIRTKESVKSRGAKSATPSPQKRDETEPKYIRIRLKPDYMYSQEDDSTKPKPDTLDLTEQQQASTSIESKAPSPKLARQNLIKEIGSKTPSPSLSRKSSFASLFRSKETIISPDSPTIPGACRRKSTITGILKDAGDKVRERSRSRSKSRERDKEKSLSAAPSSTESIDSKTKQKSMFSIFKSSSAKKIGGGGGSEKKTEEPLEALKLEFKFNDTKHELQCDSIRIPLHSPTHYSEQHFEDDLVAQGLVAQTSRQLSLREQSLAAEKEHEQNMIEQSLVEQAIQQSIEQSIEDSLLQSVKTSSQDSQDTVIEVPPVHRVQAVVEVEPKRQSSTSSENVVFSTKLGSNEFITKLPKDEYAGKKDEQNRDEHKKDEFARKKDGHAKKKDGCVIIDEFNKDEYAKKNDCANKKEYSSKRDEDVDEKDECVNKKDECANKKGEYAKKKDEYAKKKDEYAKKKDEYAKNGAVPRVTNGEIEEILPRTTSSLSSLEAKLVTSATSIDDGNSSESERGSELDFSKNKKEDLKLDLDYLEPERKNLVLQDSYEDELPYVPTTLPQEQSAIVPIVPIKQRSTFEMKTIPIERPRSTTPINPSCLEEYCEEVMGAFNSKAVTETIEKLKISLPRHDSIKSPRKPAAAAAGNTNWFEFAEKGLARRSSQDDTPPPPPPLPPKGVQKEWINFEEIPERRKPPKKIQTLPSRGHIEVPEAVLQQHQQQQQENVVYNYVNPEECKCECHDITARGKDKAKGIEPAAAVQPPAEDELPLLVDEEGEAEDKPKPLLGVAASDRRSVVSDSSADLSVSVEPPETTGGVALRTPFTSDLGVSSNRSSIVSQDETRSPDSGSPNAFPKTF